MDILAGSLVGKMSGRGADKIFRDFDSWMTLSQARPNEQQGTSQRKVITGRYPIAFPFDFVHYCFLTKNRNCNLRNRRNNRGIEITTPTGRIQLHYFPSEYRNFNPRNCRNNRDIELATPTARISYYVPFEYRNVNPRNRRNNRDIEMTLPTARLPIYYQSFHDQ